MACSKSLTNDEIKGRIKNIFIKFVSGVEPEKLSDWLVQENVITPEQSQRIHNNNPTRESRCRGLLYHLFNIPHPKAFIIVRKALVEENHYLLESIDNQAPGSEISSLPDAQIAFQDTEKIKHQQESDFDEKKRSWDEEKDHLLKTINEYEHQKKAWEAERDRLMKIINEHENQKRAWEEERDRLLKMQKDLEAQPSLVAASILENAVEDFKDQRMLVTKNEDHTVHVGRGRDSDADADADAGTLSAKELLSPKYVVSGSFNKVKVSGIPKDVSLEMISMYFENKKRSGGGKHRVFGHHREKGKVVLQFDNPEDGLEVYKRTHVLSGATVDISAVEMPLDDVKSCAIEVKGLCEGATETMLDKYFEDTRRSGGFAVQQVFINEKARTAVIVFEQATGSCHGCNEEATS